jgi:hypothetical protein
MRGLELTGRPGGRAVTVTGHAPDDLTPARPDGSGTPIPGRRTAFDDLADQAARLPWCWPGPRRLQALGLGGDP